MIPMNLVDAQSMERAQLTINAQVMDRIKNINELKLELSRYSQTPFFA
jgi:hypothetical protein